MNRLQGIDRDDLDWARLRGPRIVAALAADERGAAIELRAAMAAVIATAMLVGLAVGWLDASDIVLLFFVDAAAVLAGDALRWTLAARGVARYYTARRDEQRLAEIHRAQLGGGYDAGMIISGRTPLAAIIGMTVLGAAALGCAWATLVMADPALAGRERLDDLVWAIVVVVLLRLGEAGVDVVGDWTGLRPRGFLPRFPVQALLAVPAAVVMVAVADERWGHAVIAGGYYAIVLGVASMMLWAGYRAWRDRGRKAEPPRSAMLREWLATLKD
jgi:hypothetical protein